MKHYVGLDVSQNEVSICVVNMEGLVIAEGKVATEPVLILAWIKATVGGRIIAIVGGWNWVWSN